MLPEAGKRRIIEQCIKEHRVLSFVYRDGAARCVEPHAIGLNTGGDSAVLGWLRGGYSASGAITGWRQYRLDGIEKLERTDERFEGPRAGFRGPGREFSEVWECVEPTVSREGVGNAEA